MGVGIWILGIGRYEISCLKDRSDVSAPGWVRKEGQSGRGNRRNW